MIGSYLLNNNTQQILYYLDNVERWPYQVPVEAVTIETISY